MRPHVRSVFTQRPIRPPHKAHRAARRQPWPRKCSDVPNAKQKNAFPFTHRTNGMTAKGRIPWSSMRVGLLPRKPASVHFCSSDPSTLRGMLQEPAILGSFPRGRRILSVSLSQPSGAASSAGSGRAKDATCVSSCRPASVGGQPRTPGCVDLVISVLLHIECFRLIPLDTISFSCDKNIELTML